jgi:energy-converting hydrogenase A subunit P
VFALNLESSKCVRAVTKFSTCTNCQDICPTNAVQFSTENNLPTFLPTDCVNCAGCMGVCPSEALSLDFYKNTDFFFEFVQSEETLLSCKKNLPCLAALNTEHIISMALLKDEVVFDMGHCQSCDIREPLENEIRSKVDEANTILEAMESGKQIILKEIAYEPKEGEVTDRRNFLEQFSLRNAVKTKEAFDKEVDLDPEEFLNFGLDTDAVAKIKNKQFPDKRKILFTALKRANKPEYFHILDNHDLSFVSMKDMDQEACTACQMCYRICPTGALTSDYKNSKIDFDPFMCIKCHVCHDVCEPDAITIADTFSIKNFFEPELKHLAKFTVRKCHECDTYFDYRGGEVICRRCKLEEEEANELWGLS